MRREHEIISGGIPLPPFAENLVFWAPLTEGDLTDHVSGVSPTAGTGSCTWETNKGAYLFVTNQNDGQRCLIYEIPNGIDFKQSENYNFTIYSKVFIVSYETTVDFGLLGAGATNYQDGNTVFSLFETHRFNTSTNNPVTVGTWHELCMTRDTRNVVFYVDKSVSRTSYWEPNGNYPSLNISKAVQQETNKCFCVGTVFYNHKFTACCKDLRIYDRVLTASEVAQL